MLVSRLDAPAQGGGADLLALQQAQEVAQLQQEAVRVARELDAHQLLALLQQQEMAAQQEQVGQSWWGAVSASLASARCGTATRRCGGEAF